jgi:hypothetical protein
MAPPRAERRQTAAVLRAELDAANGRADAATLAYLQCERERNAAREEVERLRDALALIVADPNNAAGKARRALGGWGS